MLRGSRRRTRPAKIDLAERGGRRVIKWDKQGMIAMLDSKLVRRVELAPVSLPVVRQAK